VFTHIQVSFRTESKANSVELVKGISSNNPNWKDLLPVERNTLFNWRPPIQFHGPGAIQFVGLGLPEAMALTIGERKPSTVMATLLNEAGT